MLKTIEKLVTSDKEKSIIGHHRMTRFNHCRHFWYYDTAVCVANDNAKIFTIDNGGYNTSSTSRAINDYIKYFTSQDYTLNDVRKAN